MTVSGNEDAKCPAWLPALAWGLCTGVLFLVALVCNHQDAAWAQVQVDAKALQKQRFEQLQAKITTVSQLLRQLNLSEPQIRRQTEGLGQLSEEQYNDFLTDLRLQVEYKQVQDSFKQHENWDQKIKESQRIQAKLKERRMAKYKEAQGLQREARAQKLSSKSILTLLIVGGVVAAILMSRPPELRPLRSIQLVLIPSVLVSMHYTLVPAYARNHTSEADLGDFLCFVPAIMILGVILAPNIAHFFAHMLQSTIDPQDWKQTPGEVVLAPIRRLFLDDKYAEALAELNQALASNNPSYEALLLKAKLLFHLGRPAECRQILLQMLPLSRTMEQQKTVMECLREAK